MLQGAVPDNAAIYPCMGGKALLVTRAQKIFSFIQWPKGSGQLSCQLVLDVFCPLDVYSTGCSRLMANGDYWGLMGIYFHAINPSWGLLGINGDYWGSPLTPINPQ